MKFKIQINTCTGKWEVFLKHTMFGSWRLLRNSEGSPQSFNSYDEVVKNVKERGIDKIYHFHKSIFHYNPVGHEPIERPPGG